MPNELDPVIDQWYLHSDKGDLLRVIAVDRATDAIEIQNFDGNLEELDFDTWHDMDIDLAEEPEDWTGPYDNVDADALDTSETTLVEQNWHTSLNTASAQEEPWQDARPLDERDEEEEGRPLESYLSEQDPHQQRAK